MVAKDFSNVDACPQLAYDFGLLSLHYFGVSLLAVLLAAFVAFMFFKNYLDKKFDHQKDEGLSNE